MPPPKPGPRMTANPIRPGRYRPGKAVAEEQSSDEEEAEAEDGDPAEAAPPPKAPPPKASSFPKKALAATSNLKNLALNEIRIQDQARERARLAEERLARERLERDAGFVTESEEETGSEREDDEDGTGSDRGEKAQRHVASQRRAGSTSSGSEESDSEEESSSEEETARKPLRPVFIKKAARANIGATSISEAARRKEEEAAQAEAARKLETNNALIQARIDAEAAQRAAGARQWDEVDLTGDGETVLDDTDGLNPELEHREWVARELARLKRSRAALEEREAEIAEVERRRHLSTPDREAEDRKRLAEQKDAKEGRGKAAFMARYHHKGAFFGDSEDKDGVKLAERDLMGAEYEGNVQMMEALPKYLQVRDQTMVGRKGRQKHRDLKSEDTGRWGDFGDRRGGKFGGDRGGGNGYVQDERFRPDRPGEGGDWGATGANASSVREREKKRPADGARDEGVKRLRREEEQVR